MGGGVVGQFPKKPPAQQKLLATAEAKLVQGES